MSAALEQPRFEQRGEILIAGLNESYIFETRSNIPSQWNRLMPLVGRISGKQGSVFYGVCWNFQLECGFDYLAGVEVGAMNALPAGLSHLRLAPQNYAVFFHREHVSSLPETLDAIWIWLRENNREAAEAPSFECYTEAFDSNTGLGGVEIWMPVKN